MTSVSPSQCPFDHPIQLSAGASIWSSMYTVRTAPANSKSIMTWARLWMIWNGNGMYMPRGVPGR